LHSERVGYIKNNLNLSPTVGMFESYAKLAVKIGCNRIKKKKTVPKLTMKMSERDKNDTPNRQRHDRPTFPSTYCIEKSTLS
jgi:hypothetical protein